MLSMKAKYALRALMVMARNEKKMLQTRTISKEADVPHKFLEAILSDLRSQGVVVSKRGILGGYRLARPADAIMVGEVVRRMDGPLAPLRCASVTAYQPCEDCVDVAGCAVRKMMVEVRHAIAGVLDNRTIRDLLFAPEPPVSLEGV